MDNYIGSKEMPCKNIYELQKAIKGRIDLIIYTLGTFNISDELYQEIKHRNIKLCGVNQMYFRK